jgi:hypothetical protein
MDMTASAYTGPVVLIDELGDEQTAHVELVDGADPRTPTINTWHGRIRNGCEPRWLALTNYTLRLRFADGREGTALVDRTGAILGIGHAPFGE